MEDLHGKSTIETSGLNYPKIRLNYGSNFAN